MTNRSSALISLGAALAVASVFFVFREHPIRSIAILPAQAPAEMEQLCVGLADAVSMRLGNSRSLRVLPASAVYRYQGKQYDAVSAGKQLHVDAVMLGNLRLSAGRVLGSIQVIRIEDGQPLASGEIDQPEAGLFALEDALASILSKALHGKLTDAQRQSLARHPATTVETHRLVLTGRYLHFQQQDRPAIQPFQGAVELDPRYAPAWTGLSTAYFGACYDGSLAPREGMPLARDAALRAINLNANLAPAYSALAAVQLWFEYNLAAADKSSQRAWELDPQDPGALNIKAFDALFAGNFLESIATRRNNLPADPTDPRAFFLVSMALYYSGVLPDAIEYSNRALQLDPNFTPAQEMLAAIARREGRGDEYVAFSIRANPSYAPLEQAYRRGGLKSWDEARLEMTLNRQQLGQRISPVFLAGLYRDVGDHEKALDWLEEAYAERNPNMMTIKTDPEWASLSSNPRFQSLVSKMK